jgi:ribosomal protein L32
MTSSEKQDATLKRFGRRWKRIHRAAMASGKCPECGEEGVTHGGAVVYPCGHGRDGLSDTVNVRDAEVMPALTIATAYEVAARSEEALPGVVEAALTRLVVCGTCGHARGRHKEDGPCGRCVGGQGEPCGVFSWSVTQAEINGTVVMLAGLSRHKERIDRDLGLDKVQISETIKWLPGVNVAEWKKMTAEEQDRKLLEQIGVKDAEVVEKKE